MGWPVPKVFNFGDPILASEIHQNNESLSIKISGGITGDEFEPGQDAIPFSQDIDLADGKVINVGNIPANWIEVAASDMSTEDGARTYEALKSAILKAEDQDLPGSVWLPPGDWALTTDAPIAIPPGIEVFGNGQTTCRFRLLGNSQQAAFHLIGSASVGSRAGAALSDLTIYRGDDSETERTGILITGRNCRLANTWLHDIPGWCVKMQDCRGTYLESVRANSLGSTGGGFSLTGGRENKYANCAALQRNNEGGGFWIDGCDNDTFVSCFGIGCGIGMDFYDCSQVKILGCNMSGCYHGIAGTLLNEATMSGCAIEDSEGWDLHLFDVIRGRFTGNKFLTPHTEEGDRDRVYIYLDRGDQVLPTFLGNSSKGGLWLRGKLFPHEEDNAAGGANDWYSLTESAT